MIFKGYITEEECKRTAKLLYNIRQKYGIYTFMTLKKMLTIGIIIEHYQKTYKNGPWISYNCLLKRYENGYDFQGYGKDYFMVAKEGTLYGFKGRDILNSSQTQVEKMVFDRCEYEFSKYELPKEEVYGY